MHLPDWGRTALAATGIGIVAVMGGTAYVAGVHASSYSVTAEVTKTWTQYSENHTVNLIGTDKGVFEDSDSVPYLKFNSSDFYNELIPGKTYTFTVTGWRIPFLSAYPNIVSCEDC